MRKDPLAGRPQATPPAADGAKLGDGPEGGRLLDFSGRQSRGWGRERGPPRHDYITIICILYGPLQVRISSINLTYINFTGIFDMSVPRSREACSALGTIARPSVYPAERRLGAHFNLPVLLARCFTTCSYSYRSGYSPPWSSCSSSRDGRMQQDATAFG